MKRRNGIVLFASVALAAASGVSTAQVAGLVGIHSTEDKLIFIDQSDGSTSSILPTDPADGLLGLAFDPISSTLFGARQGPGDLVRIDLATGTFTSIGPLGFGNVRGLAWDPIGERLLGVGGSADKLFEIDTATGAGTAIGSRTLPDGINSLAFDPISGDIFGANVVANSLVRIDPVTGQATSVGGFGGFNNVAGLAFDLDSGTLFGVNGNNNSGGELIRIDTATGAATVVGPLSGGAFANGLAYVPTPAGAAVLGVGGLVAARRRRRL